MKTTLPSLLWATPCASRSSDSTFNHSSGCVMGCDYSCRSMRPVAARALHCLPSGESFLVKPPKAQVPSRRGIERSGKRTGKRFIRSVPRWREARFERAHRRGKRTPATAPANLSGKADREGLFRCVHGAPSATQPLETCDVRDPPAEDAAACAASRTRREDGRLRRLRHAGRVPRRHHRGASALPFGGCAVRRLSHGPGRADRRRCGARPRDAGADGRGRPAAPQAALRVLHQLGRRHPRRPDDRAPRGPSVPGRQRGLQGSRLPPPQHQHRRSLHGAPASPIRRCLLCKVRAPSTRWPGWRPGSARSRS